MIGRKQLEDAWARRVRGREAAKQLGFEKICETYRENGWLYDAPRDGFIRPVDRLFVTFEEAALVVLECESE